MVCGTNFGYDKKTDCISAFSSGIMMMMFMQPDIGNIVVGRRKTLHIWAAIVKLTAYSCFVSCVFSTVQLTMDVIKSSCLIHEALISAGIDWNFS